MKSLLKRSVNVALHLYGRINGRYYCEDFNRVYPDGVVYNRLGLRRKASADEEKNYLNHRKFYRFAAQFVAGKKVADIGCGSGHGCALMHQTGAAGVWGADISKHSLAYARSRFGHCAAFSEQGITNLEEYVDGYFDVTVCSEVLEHILEYGREDDAVREVSRVTRPDGIVILATPNAELSPDHGFSFDALDTLMRRHFSRYVIFENALVPFDERRNLWEDRITSGKLGRIVTQAINLDETVLPAGITPQIKQGETAGTVFLDSVAIDTSLLHNTHSWVVVALRDR